MQRDLILHIMLADCQQLSDLSNIAYLGRLLVQLGFSMLVFPKEQPQGVVLTNVQVVDYLSRTAVNELQNGALLIGRKYPVSYGRRLLAEEKEWGLALSCKDGRTDVLVSGPLLDMELQDQQALIEPLAQRLRGLAWEMHTELQSSIVSIDELGRGHGLFEGVMKRKLRYINWVNIFGPPYVEKYGREFLLGLPGYETRELPDGSIYYQLSPTFLTDDSKAARTLRQDVVEYCAQAGWKVICQAPYQIAKARPAPIPPKEQEVPDESVRLYMQEVLGETKILDDGTRVKAISVPWDALTVVQQQIALGMIKAAATEEIREHRHERIRFEFGELPEVLDAMMADLVGRDNPAVEYMQAAQEITDKSVQDYMQGILSTTLLLDDGTRVKPISVPWEVLSSAQQQLALDMIKAAAVAEIHQHSDKRIRFEFNEIIEELESMLLDLVGRDNPGFEFALVDMSASEV